MTRKYRITLFNRNFETIPGHHSRITLDEKIALILNDDHDEAISLLKPSLYKPMEYNGWGYDPSVSANIDMPNYGGSKEFFVFRLGDFITREEALAEVFQDIRILAEYSEDPPVEGEQYLLTSVDSDVAIDKDYYNSITGDSPITLTAEEGKGLDSVTVTRYSGSPDGTTLEAFENLTEETELIGDASGSAHYTFKLNDYFAPTDLRVLYYEISASTGELFDEPLEPIVVPLETDILGAYVDPDLTEVHEQEETTVTITANHFHYLTRVEVIEETPTGNNVITIPLDSDKEKTVTIALGSYLNRELTGLKLLVRASKPTTPLMYLNEEDALASGFPPDVQNATVHPVTGTQVNDDTVITITANSGRAINDVFSLIIRLPEELRTHSKTDEEYYIYPEDPNYSDYFNEDNTTVRIPLSDFWIEDYYTYPPNRVIITGVDSIEPQISEGFVTSYATIYKMDKRNLDIFTDSLLNVGDPTFMDSIYNKVHSIFMIPFKLPPSMISLDPKNITRYDTGTTHKIDAEAHYLLDNKYILPLGSIEVEGEYNNVYDFKGTETYLHAPYVEQPISIDPSYVINETVTLNMAIDLYNGNATLNIHSSKIDDELVQRENIPIKHEIPLMSNAHNVIEGEIGGFIYNQVTTPFIEVVRNVPYENDSLFGKEMSSYGKIGDYSGYIEMSDTNVQTEATTQEQNMISSQLLSGVVIRPQ